MAKTKTAKGRVFGSESGSAKVHAWMAPSEAEADKLPMLAAAVPKGWQPPQIDDGEVSLPAGIEEDSTHAFIFHHSREAAAVVRTIITRDEGGPLDGMTSRQSVAALFCGLGQEVGSLVLGHLGRDEMKYATEAITTQGAVTHVVAMQVLEHVRQRMASGDYLEDFGKEYARRLLGGAVHYWQVDRVLEGSLHEHTGFQHLNTLESTHVASFIAPEHPETIALILTQLEPDKAAGILACLPDKLQQDVAHRTATMDSVSAETVDAIGESLIHTFSGVVQGSALPGGPQPLAAILNASGAKARENVLDQLDKQAPEVAESVRNHMRIARGEEDGQIP